MKSLVGTAVFAVVVLGLSGSGGVSAATATDGATTTATARKVNDQFARELSETARKAVSDGKGRSLQLICDVLAGNFASQGFVCPQCAVNDESIIEIQCTTEEGLPNCSLDLGDGPGTGSPEEVCADVTLTMTLSGMTAEDATVSACYTYVDGRSPELISGKVLCSTYSLDDAGTNCEVDVDGEGCVCMDCGEKSVMLDCSDEIPGMVSDCRVLGQENAGSVPVFGGLGEEAVDADATPIPSNDTAATTSPSPTPDAANMTTMPPTAAEGEANATTTAEPTAAPTDAPEEIGGGGEDLCLATGGNVTESLCCLSASDFPDTCLIGACGCGPMDSHNISTCSCPTGACFNATAGCVDLATDDTDPPTAVPTPAPNMTEQCLMTGGNLTTSVCCLSSGDFPNTCLIGACGCAPMDSHNVTACACPEGSCFDGTGGGCVAPEVTTEPTASPTNATAETDAPTMAPVEPTSKPTDPPTEEPVPEPTDPPSSAWMVKGAVVTRTVMLSASAVFYTLA